MLVTNQKVIAKWNNANRKWYQEKGYHFTKNGDEFEVLVEQLTKGSHFYIKIICDYCGYVFEKQYYNYIKRKETEMISKDCCAKCQPLKVIEVNRIKYGCEASTQRPEVRDKIMLSLNERYGVDNPVEIPEVLEKARKTNLERYGVEYTFQSKEIRNKGVQTMYQLGSAPTSKPQQHIHRIIKGELNYPIGYSSLDIAFPDEKIYVEYDGGGHWLSIVHGSETQEQFDTRQRKRSYFLKSQGWKEVRIISIKDLLPSNDTLSIMMSIAHKVFDEGRSWIYFDIDNNVIKYKNHEEYFDFGDLIKIKELELQTT